LSSSLLNGCKEILMHGLANDSDTTAASTVTVVAFTATVVAFTAKVVPFTATAVAFTATVVAFAATVVALPTLQNKRRYNPADQSR